MRTIFAYLLLFFSVNSIAQTNSYLKRPAIGLHAAFLDFKGADTLKLAGRSIKTGLSLNFQNNFSSHWGYNITVAGAFLDFPGKGHTSLGNGKEELLLETDFSIQARLAAPTSWIGPYLQAGVGLSKYNNYYGVFIPAGAGVQVNFSEDIFLLVNTQYRLPVTNTQHQHFYHSIGLAGTIGKKKITKPLPPPPLPVVQKKTNPDTDGDGIIDSLDKCPDVAGTARYNGCPVPDRDKDGINDDNDSCPDIPGLARYKGCPVPDRDHDQVNDEEDLCPDIPGPVDKKGCPEITAAIQTRIETAAKNILFETGSYNLLTSSYSSLNDVVMLLQQNPHLVLLIEGHTDSVGTEKDNQLLSENRAKEVMSYLVKKGIAEIRIKAQGFGEMHPVTTNKSPEGRARNRRVAFKLEG